MSVKYTHFITDEVIPVCFSESYLAKSPGISLANLKNIPKALREHGSGTLEAIKISLNSLGINLTNLNIIIRLGGTEALKNFLLADNCLGFLPKRSVIKEIESGALVMVNIQHLSIIREFYFIQRQGTENDGLNNAFVQFAIRHYN